VLDQRGIVDRFLAEGEAMQVQSFAMIPLDISDFPTRHNYGLALWQKDFEMSEEAELGTRRDDKAQHGVAPSRVGRACEWW